jgi:hypothetical protein
MELSGFLQASALLKFWNELQYRLSRLGEGDRGLEPIWTS